MVDEGGRSCPKTEIARAIHWCVQNNRLVVEGAGRRDSRRFVAKKVRVNSDDTVCAVLCGGNIDPNLLARVLENRF
jgi:threonine dehydratase